MEDKLQIERETGVKSHEIVIAFVAAVGVNLELVEQAVANRLTKFQYDIEKIKVTRHVLPKLV